MAHWTRMAFRATIEDAPAHVLTMLELLCTDEDRALEYYNDNTELFTSEFFEGYRWASFLNGSPGIYPDWGKCTKVISKDQTVWELDIAWTQRSGSGSLIEFIRWLKDWIVEEETVIGIAVCDLTDDMFRKYWIESDLPATGVVNLDYWIDDEDADDLYELAENKPEPVAQTAYGFCIGG